MLIFNREITLNRAFLILIFLSCLVFGIYFRFWGIDRPFWFDELYSIVMSSQPLIEIPAFQAQYDIHPPLYSIVLHIWNSLIGGADSEIHLRLLSILLGFATCFPLAMAAYEMKGKHCAIIVGMLSLVNPILIIVATEVRQYVLLSTLSAFALYLFIKLFKNANKTVAAFLFIGCSLSCTFTHYIGGIFVFCIIAIGLFAAPDWQTRRALLASAFMVGCLFLPWLNNFLNQLSFENLIHSESRNALTNMAPMPILAYVASLYAISAGGSSRFFGLLYALWVIGTISVLVFSLFKTSHKKENASEPLEIVVLLLWTLGPLVYTCIVAILKGRLTSATYLISFGQISILLVGMAGYKLSKKSTRLFMLYLSLTILISIVASWNKLAYTQKHEDWPLAAQYYTKNISDDDTVIFSNSISKYLLAWYAPKALSGFGNYVYACSIKQDIPRKEILGFCEEKQSVWVIDCYGAASANKVSNLLATNGFVLESRERRGPFIFSLWRRS